MLKSSKPNRCKHCKARMPEDKARHVLHDECKDAWIAVYRKKQEQKKGREQRAKAKVERADTRRRKEAIKTIPALIREAQMAFNAWIRARDAARPCISCDAPPPDLSQLHAGRDAGHYRSTGSASHLRFHPDNCHAQCVQCNQWGAGKAVDYRIRLVPRIGADRVEALECNNEIHKWRADELREIRDTYRAKTKEMKKEATC